MVRAAKEYSLQYTMYYVYYKYTCVLQMWVRVVCRARWLLTLTIVAGVLCSSSWLTLHSRGHVSWSEVTASPQQQNLTLTRYVTLCEARLRDSHRTGNHLFLLAGLLYAARLTGRTVSMPIDRWLLDDVFQLDWVFRYGSGPSCPCHEFTHPEERPKFYHGDDNLDVDEGRAALRQDLSRTLRLCGLYQTYRYADAEAPTMRSLLRFRPDVLDTAHQILNDGRPPEWTRGSYTRVGLHIRRGDFLDHPWAEYGLAVVDRRYVNHAVDYFTSKFARVQLVVASDDPSWIGDVLREKLTPLFTRSTASFISMTSRSVAVTLSRNQSPAVDLALLVACDAMILSTTSSFGWWAAWLANRTTIYCDRWARVGSGFSREFDRRRYFPKHWIPLQ